MEDLGGGYKTIFRLENGFSILNGTLGQNGRLFGRQAYVGIEGPLATVTVGRQYDPIVDFLGPIFSNGRGNLPLYDLDNTGNDFRTNNSIKIISKKTQGFQVGAMYGFGGVVGQFSRDSVVSAGAGYEYGPLRFGVAYTAVNNPYEAWYDNTGASSIAAYGAYLPNAKKLTILGGGASYTSGPFAVRAGMTHNVLENSYLGQNVRFNLYQLQGDYWFTPTFRMTVMGQVDQGNVEATGAPRDYRQINLVADYFLSKLTDVYMWASYQRAIGPGAVAQIGYAFASSNNHQANIHFAIRKKF
ncbi:Outer membrane protein (porin) [Paraburkholderia susongensis]|uniref:Outer membrane protein (Porin) n=1 Tax=Paraburkholderia susongensis TaxID=1515439 RepID=A0A1X7LNV0_9BURK|nr:Outer membrane protein (porin) [Paraburkholderia susongensis]